MISMMICFKGDFYNSIRLKDIVEVFQDYKKPALLLCTCYCDWKCCAESGTDSSLCQNSRIAKQREVKTPFASILKKVNASLTDAVIFGGLEPMMQIDEVVQCIEYLRKNGVEKDIIIYTGYYIEELDSSILYRLKNANVILKCGRFIPNRPSKLDPTLGVVLASDNQYGVYL